MRLKNKIKEIVKGNDRLYVIARSIRSSKDPDLVKLLRGYYERRQDCASILAVHNGTKYPDTVVYHVEIYKTVEQEKVVRSMGKGFAAAIWWTLKAILFAEHFGMVPVVEWGNTATYYDSGMDSITKNTFEYYYEPVSEIKYEDIKNCRNVIKYNMGHAHFFAKSRIGYLMEQEEIEEMGHVYKKYMHLNKTTQEYIEINLEKMLKDDRVLAVHVRGTDFKIGCKDHPMVISPEDYLAKAVEVYSRGKYDKIFLATDDAEALKIFKDKFKDQLLYYTDVIRTEGYNAPFAVFNSRPLHYYKLGLEVLRDIYTLANCDSLICSHSGVAFAARYISVSLDRKFNKVVVLDKGMNTEDSDVAEKYRHFLHNREKVHKS